MCWLIHVFNPLSIHMLKSSIELNRINDPCFPVSPNLSTYLTNVPSAALPGHGQAMDIKMAPRNPYVLFKHVRLISSQSCLAHIVILLVMLHYTSMVVGWFDLSCLICFVLGESSCSAVQLLSNFRTSPQTNTMLSVANSGAEWFQRHEVNAISRPTVRFLLKQQITRLIELVHGKNLQESRGVPWLDSRFKGGSCTCSHQPILGKVFFYQFLHIFFHEPSEPYFTHITYVI